jgi:hypothetical protein
MSDDEKPQKGPTLEQRLQRENKELKEALRDLFSMMEEGFLVRDISKDHEPNWVFKMMSFVSRLKKAQDLIRP